MTYLIVVEPTAEREIRSAVRWKTEHGAPTVAARWYNGLIKKIDTLRLHPSRCPLTAETDKFPEEIRELLYGRGGKRTHKHRIIFSEQDEFGALHALVVGKVRSADCQLSATIANPRYVAIAWSFPRESFRSSLRAAGSTGRSRRLPHSFQEPS